MDIVMVGEGDGASRIDRLRSVLWMPSPSTGHHGPTGLRVLV